MVDLLPDAVYRFADWEDGLFDLHIPKAPNGTLVVLVHGGFWKQEFDRTHTRAQARDLAESGFLVVTPEYSRVGGRGGWPLAFRDLTDVLQDLPDDLAQLGLSFERAAMIGHSAGGHLALRLLEFRYPMTFDVVVSLAGVVDLVLADELGLGGDAVSRFLEGAPIAEADPMTVLTTPRDRIVLVHGDADDTVPVELSRRFAATHSWAELIELPGVGHYEFLDPTTTAWAAVVDALRLS